MLFKLLVFKSQVFQTSCVQIPGCHSAPPDCPSRSTVHPPSPEVHIWSLMIDQYWKGKKESSKWTVYNLPSPHYTCPTNALLERFPFRDIDIDSMSGAMKNEAILSNQCRISLVFLKTSTLGLQSPLRKSPFSRSLGECFCFSIVITQSSSSGLL